MENKTCLITGGTSGVGKATALGLAGMGAKVVIVSRNDTTGESAVQDIKQKSGNPNITYLSADLSEPLAIRTMVETFQRKYDRLHVLANNAAVLTTKRRLNSQGYEMIFMTNYLSHFLLTNLLLDALKKSVPSRIITVVGNRGLVKQGRIYFNDLQLEQSFNPLKATLQSALAKTIFAFELAKKIEGSGVTSK